MERQVPRDARTELLGLADIHEARQRIAGGIDVTPLVAASADPAYSHLFLKCENLQRGGAFKLRGALNFLLQLDAGALSRGVITYSSGNHGQAMAIAAARLGAPAVVVMPTTAPPVKVENARRFGAEVVFAGTTSLQRKERAEAMAAERGMTIVPPFDHARIVAGQGTVALELLEQRPDVTAVYVPAGGGGLIAGVAAAIKRSAPHVRVVGVEPDGAPKMTRSLSAGAPATLDRIDSIADGLLAVRPGDLTFAHIEALVDEVITVSDDEIRAAMRWIASHAKLVAEPSGATAVAGALRLAPPGSPGVHVAIVSGGNLELSLLAAVLAEQPR
jgi:threonine dehydratase